MTDLRKRYGPSEVVKGVNLTVARGSVHALLGPNGAGKSTLIKCISGATRPDGGGINLHGVELFNLSPMAARQAGVATIHQNLSIVDSLSIADNIFLGRELSSRMLLSRREEEKQAAALLGQFGLDLDPRMIVGHLSSGHKQSVEIVKAWGQGEVKVLILDEPTASLSRNESERLFGEIDAIRNRGVCVIYVTHRLGEVFRIADQVTVMRNGVVVMDAPTTDLTPPSLVRAMSGTTVGSKGNMARIKASRDSTAALRVDRFAGPRFGPLTFFAYKGEVLGLYGSIGSGRTSLLETLAGRYRPTSGHMSLYSADAPRTSIGSAIKSGIALVPGDRNRQGLWPSLGSGANTLMPHYSRLSRLGLRSRVAEQLWFSDIVNTLDVQPSDPDVPASALSGGNAQKLLIGRWLACSEDLQLLLLDEPTSGVDVETRSRIHSAIQQAANLGLTILVSSSDAEELVQVADRVCVFDNGEIVGELAGPEITERALLTTAHQFDLDAGGRANGATREAEAK